MVHSPDGDTDFVNIKVGVLLEGTLALLLFVIALDHVLRTSIDSISQKDLLYRHPKVDDIPLLLSLMQTMQMIWHFSQIHMAKYIFKRL